jgi:hypothetical protein
MTATLPPSEITLMDEAREIALAFKQCPPGGGLEFEELMRRICYYLAEGNPRIGCQCDKVRPLLAALRETP